MTPWEVWGLALIAVFSAVIETPVTLPYRYAPRSYSAAVLEAFRRGVRRFLLLWHRRASKSTTAVQVLVMAAVETVGVYWIVTPTFALGRRIYWDGLTHDGHRLLIGYIPPECIASISENEMQIVLTNGSVIQIVGADQPDRLARGPGLRGVVFDEFSVMPTAQPWDTVRPILMENDGWAFFAFTPLGRNHAHQLYETVRDAPDWYVSRLTVEDTHRDAPGESGGPVVAPEAIARERRDGMPEDMVQQEFMLSFNASLPGVYYAKELQRAEAEGRIDRVPWTASAPVHTVMDLGVADATVILFFQLVGPNVHLLDVEVGVGEGTAYYASRLQAIQRERRWVYGQHFAPHDARQRSHEGVTRVEQYKNLGIKLVVLERLLVETGIAAARAILPRTRFDRDRCRRLVDALAQYRSEWNEERQVLALRPRHDWSSDFADSFRYLALAVDVVERREHRSARPPGKAKLRFNPFDTLASGGRPASGRGPSSKTDFSPF